MKKKYTWKDIVKINGVIYAEEHPISGKIDDDSHYCIDWFFNTVGQKYKVPEVEIETYMMDNIEFDVTCLPYGAAECGCYINGIAEWLLE